MPRRSENARSDRPDPCAPDQLPPGAPEDGPALAERLGFGPGVIRRAKAQWDLDNEAAERELRNRIYEHGYPTKELPLWVELHDQDISEFFIAIPEGGLLFVRRAFPAESWEWVAKRLVFPPKPVGPSKSPKPIPPTYMSTDTVELLRDDDFDWRSAAARAQVHTRAISAYRRTWPNCEDARSAILQEAKNATAFYARLPRGVVPGHEYSHPVLLCDASILEVRIDDKREILIRSWHEMPAKSG